MPYDAARRAQMRDRIGERQTEIREKRVTAAGESPQRAEDQQCKDGITRTEMPRQPVDSADLAARPAEYHQDGEQPVEHPRRQIPDAGRVPSAADHYGVTCCSSFFTGLTRSSRLTPRYIAMAAATNTDE